MKIMVCFITFAGALAVSCAGNQPQNSASASLVTFADSGCKKESANVVDAPSATAGQALVSTDYSTETVGLKCIAWEALQGGRIKIDLTNFESSCGPKFVGGAAVSGGGALDLTLENPSCLIAKCGACIYDWSFEVDGVDTTKPLPLGVGINVCPGKEAVTAYSALLPVDTKPSGIVCNYAKFSALGWQAATLNQCGTMSMPCNGTAMCSGGGATTEPTCTGDLVCSDNGNAAERVCAKSCVSDADCGSLGVLGCSAGLCRPRNNW